MAGNHAKKGPSGAKQLHACPGALALVEALPAEQRSGSNEAAQRGTAAHFLLEKCLTERLPPSTFEGRIIVLLGDKEDGSMLKPSAKMPRRDVVHFIVNDDMVYGVTMAYDYVLHRLTEFDPRDVELLLESKTNPVPDRDDTWGTADVTIDVFLLMLEVVDYKNGYGVVEHRDNPQLLSYLAGRAHDTGWSHNAYRITVVQPNADHEDGRVRSFDISREDLQAFVVKHRAAAEKADEASDVLHDLCMGDPLGDISGFVDELPEGALTWADAYLNAGSPQCDNCDASLTCPAKKKWLQGMAKVAFDEEPPESPMHNPTEIEAGKILAWSPYLLQQIKLARVVEQVALHSGRALPDRKVVRQKPRGRKFVAGLGTPFEVAAKLVKGGFISDNERTLLFTEPELLSGPKIEKLVSTKKSDVLGDDGKPLTMRRLFAREFLYMPEGRLITAPLSDPREAVVVTAGDDFPDDLEDDDEN